METEKRETTTGLWSVLEENNALVMRENISINYHSDEDDGTFPETKDFVEFAKMLDDEGGHGYYKWIENRELGYADIYPSARIIEYDGKYELLFDMPIDLLIADYNGEQIIRKCNSIKGDISWQSFTAKREQKLHDYVNEIEILFVPESYELKTYEYKNQMQWTGDIEFFLEADDVAEICQSGQNDEAVDSVTKKWYVQEQLKTISTYNILRSLGAWDDDELKDFAENQNRFIWTAAWDIHEQMDQE